MKLKFKSISRYLIRMWRDDKLILLVLALFIALGVYVFQLPGTIIWGIFWTFAFLGWPTTWLVLPTLFTFLLIPVLLFINENRLSDTISIYAYTGLSMLVGLELLKLIKFRWQWRKLEKFLSRK